MGEKKSIKISLGTTICIFIIIVLMVALIGMWFVYNRNNGEDLSAEVDSNKSVENEVEEYKEWADIEKGYKLKYPSNWNLKISDDYMGATILESPGKSKKDAAKLYIYVGNYPNVTDLYKWLDESTGPEDGIKKEELNSEENLTIKRFDTISKTQVMTYDNGDEHKIKTLMCRDNSVIYEFVYKGSHDEYEKYYKEFEQIIESVEIYNNCAGTSDFEKVYKALTNYLTENQTDLVQSNNEIEELAVTEIEIFNDKYFLEDEFDKESYPDVYNDENLLIGSCKYALKIPNQKKLELAGSGNMKKIGDWIIITQLFIIEKDTNKVELCTGF